MVTTISTTSHAVSLVMKHAEEIGLPMPVRVTFSAHADTLGVLLTFGTLDDLADWAAWLDRPVAHDPGTDATCEGLALDLPVLCHVPTLDVTGVGA